MFIARCFNFRINLLVINIAGTQSDTVSINLFGNGRDLLNLELYKKQNVEELAGYHGVIYQLESDLHIPGNILVDLNGTVASVTPDGELEYVYGNVQSFVSNYKSEYISFDRY